ncbi:MAG: M12 family metallo-peptidase, partial [Chloroflexi bacterium]|nr:M12 family metallo-peptidase [Chloroflexota bacterium]
MWSDVSQSSFEQNGDRPIVPERYRLLQLDVQQFDGKLSAATTDVILLPMPDGGARSYRFSDSSVMAPGLAERYPTIRAYEGQGIEDPSESLRFEWTPSGFRAMILSPVTGAVMIDPLQRGDVTHYMSYYRSDHVKKLGQETWTCGVGDGDVLEKNLRMELSSIGALASSGTELRTYRLALAATGEYAQYHKGSATTDADQRTNVLAAMVTTMNRVNGIFRTEAGITMQLITTTDKLIYLDGSSDPYTNNVGSTMLGQNQTNVDSVIGSVNYDVGHVFSTGGGGIASLNAPCNASRKAKGVTGLSAPIGDAFDVDYVAHEMGHQFGANHTFNSVSGACNGNRSTSSAYEPGSGTTIMAYAGICSPENLQNNSDPYFHTRSFDEMIAFTVNGNGNSCAAITSTNNHAPVVEAGAAYTIPARTPFVLTGAASDVDGDALTYQWQEYDLGTSSNSAATMTADDGTRPLFRVFNPTGSPLRYFRKITSTLTGVSSYGESLPTTSRMMNFRLIVRDGQSGVAYDSTTVRTIDSGTTFAVTTPVTGATWTAGEAGLVEWNVAGTTDAPISCASVDVLLSNDGGYSWPFVLKRATPNDGSQSVMVIGSATSQARIKVACSENIFFAASPADFAVASGAYISTAVPSTGNSAGGTAVVLSGAGLSSITSVTWNGAAIQFTLQSDASIELTSLPGNPGESVSVTLSNGQQVKI